jgi:hypothetical protein
MDGGRLAGQYPPDFDGVGTSDMFGDGMRARKAQQMDSTLDTIQGGLSMAGMLPGVGVIPDLVNAATYAARGKWGDAAMSGLQAIPFLGDLVGAKKVADNTGKVFGAENALKAGGKTMGY